MDEKKWLTRCLSLRAQGDLPGALAAARAASEVAWLRFVGGLDARLVPAVLAEIPEQHLFVMPLLDPARHPVWKSEMAAGRVDPAFAGQVGRDLARIHGAAAGRADLATDLAPVEIRQVDVQQDQVRLQRARLGLEGLRRRR